MSDPSPRDLERGFRPPSVPAAPLAGLLAAAGPGARLEGDPAAAVTGVAMDSRCVLAGDLYAAVPGARSHGADFAARAAADGAAALLADDSGAERCRATGLPVLVVPDVRAAVGPLAAAVYGTDRRIPELFGVTGTNGKTTTTYLVRSLLSALGRASGLIGTIEIAAGDVPVPSVLTTPEAPQVHGLLARMRDAGIGVAAMEVSSHSIDYRRIGGLRFGTVGFTNLTQDHLDLHGTMEDYFATKARLFAAGRAERGVVLADDEWGRRLAAESGVPTWTLRTTAAPGPGADWRVEDLAPEGLGHRFALAGPGGERLRARIGLPGLFNVANAALATVMVRASGVPADALQRALDADALTVAVPGRMQVVSTRPAAVVDFAHNPDALALALDAVAPADSAGRTIVVFGATGDRDATKRPAMGEVAARHADVVIVTDDDPHGEEPAGIRASVLAGARAAIAAGARAAEALEVAPRAAAIARAAGLAGPRDTILVAGRGHETVQEIAGVDHALDDRVELARALAGAGHGVESIKP